MGENSRRDTIESKYSNTLIRVPKLTILNYTHQICDKFNGNDDSMKTERLR